MRKNQTNSAMESSSSIIAAATAASATHQGLHRVFVYGSLLADDVVRVLLHRIPHSSPAILNGYHRFSIKGRVYPAIIPVENKQVAGKVLLDLTNRELDILDAFEDFEYERHTVEVSLADKFEKLQTYAYVWANREDPYLYGSWDFEEWTKVHKDDFMKMSSGFMEELELPESKPRVETYETFFQQNGGKGL
ncbi:AIG2-like protein D [Impatiens glandulifera]|uniref:AIG2-like protein D n=1 Tax=Impatiens glandulifera TaxID=253017 RepID=UPI001FB11A18|nr:AIG2-like protein D [Impatiens glandulifera]